MDKLRVVLVGCGHMSRTWLEAVQTMPELIVVGLVDLYLEAAQKRALEFQLDVPVGTDLAVMLKSTKPDVLFDCTVPEAHEQNAKLAFARGIHVLGEKPLASSLEAAKSLVDAAKEAGCLHAVLQNRRFDPNIRRVRRFIASNQIGEVTTINADFYIGAHFGGFRETMNHVLLLDMAIHTFDAARLLLNADPISVYCKEWNPQESWYAHGASAMCIFEMSNGSIFNYRGSWCSEGFPTTWESEWRILGTRGSIKWDGGANPQGSLVKKTSTDTDKPTIQYAHHEIQLPALNPNDNVGGHHGAIRDFILAVQQKLLPETVSSDNLKSLAMVFSAIQSAQLQQKVQIQWDV